MEQIPEVLYIDRAALENEETVEVVDKSHPEATKYVSTERLWHDGTEEPQHGRKVLAEFVDGLDYREQFVAARYEGKARLFLAEMGMYHPQSIKRWAYIGELAEQASLPDVLPPANAEVETTYWIEIGMARAYFHVIDENTVGYDGELHTMPRAKVEEFVATAKAMGMRTGKM